MYLLLSHERAPEFGVRREREEGRGGEGRCTDTFSLACALCALKKGKQPSCCSEQVGAYLPRSGSSNYVIVKYMVTSRT